jgi:ABC-type enterochelin transport system permease subunit
MQAGLGRVGDTQKGELMENEEAYQRATKRVEAKIGFYIHLAVYVGVNILLIVINLVTAPRHLWFIWPLIGWGIGIFFHGMSTFFFTGRRFKEIKNRMIQEEIKRDPR